MGVLYLFLIFGVTHIFRVRQSLNSCEKFCPWDLMITINVSVSIGQLPTRNLSLFEKKNYQLGM